MKTFLKFALLYVCLPFLIAEIAFRLTKDHLFALPIIDPEYQLNDTVHHPRPYVMSAAIPMSTHRKITHNQLGYRGELPSPVKPADEFRVFFFGGSTVYGGEASFVDLLNRKKLKFNGKNIRGYNFGASSSVSRQDLIRMIIDGAGYSPDLIVHYGGGNDFIGNADDRVNYPHRFVFYEKTYLFNSAPTFEDYLVLILTRSELLKYAFREKLEKWFIGSKPDFKDDTRLVFYKVVAYWSNLSWMASVSNMMNTDFLTILQPMQDFLPEAADQRLPLQRNFFRALTKSPKWKTPAYDCSNVFDNTKIAVYTDPIHVNMDGQKIIYDCIEKNILSFLNKRGDPALRQTEPISIPEEDFIQGVPEFKKWITDFAQTDVGESVN